MRQRKPLAAPRTASGYQIGAFYMPNWKTGAAGLSYSGLTWEQMNSYPRTQPRKGRYHHEGQRTVMEEQLAEMARHGISWLAFNWYHNETTGNPGQVLLNHALDAYLACDARLRARVKFCVNWITHSGFTPATETEWTACYENWVSQGYLEHPDYLRIDGRPVIYVFETDQPRKNAAGISDRFLTSGTYDRTVTNVNASTNELTIAETDIPATGTSISFVVSSGSAPGGLTSGQKYYAIKVSTTVVKLAETQGDALAGTAVDISSAGSGTFKLRLGLNWSPVRSHAYIYNQMRTYVQAQGLPNPFLVLGNGYPVPYWSTEYTAGTADGTSAYNYHSNYDPDANAMRSPTAHSYAELDGDYRENWEWNCANQSAVYIPTISTGWDNTPWGGGSDPEHICIPTVGEFRSHLQACKDLIDRYPTKTRRMAIVNAWNEYGEGGYLEPSYGYGRGMLRAVQQVFGL